MTRVIASIGLLVVLVIGQQGAPTSKVVAEVNGVKITLDDLKAIGFSKMGMPQTHMRGTLSPEQLRQNLDEAIGNTLLYSEASRAGLEKSPEYQAKMDAYKRQAILELYIEKVLIPSIQVSDEEIQQRYKSDRRYYEPEQLAGIMAKINDASKVAEARKYLQSIKDSPADASKETRHSPMMSNMMMPEVGKMPDGVFAHPMNISLEDPYMAQMFPTLKSAKEGEILGPPEGEGREVMLFLVQKRIPGRSVPLDSVKSEIIQQLRNEKVYEVQRQRIEQLKSKATITIYYDALPPVQSTPPPPVKQ